MEQVGKVVLDYSHYQGRDLYCDGKEEDELLALVQTNPQEEYGRIIEERRNWPILYHLSSQRENIVDWLPMDKGQKVLEIGSGPGAVTGSLARKAGSVSCVELSRKRSLINAWRHKDQDNITIHVGNFTDIEPDLPCDFDWICLIGVFEYAQGYIGTGTDENGGGSCRGRGQAYRDFLTLIRRHLKEGGHIVIAIENRLGLKYLAGCREDHLGSLFSGVEDYPEGGGVRTFTRSALENLFGDCGIEDYSFYYPYPDYKFMTDLYSDRYLPRCGELSNNMRNFDRDRLLLFDEKLAFDGILRDGLFSLFSNSYLVVTGEALPVEYARYSNDRTREYAVKTFICRERDGGRVAKKRPLFEQGAQHIREMAEAYEELEARYRGRGLEVVPCSLETEGERLAAVSPYVEGRTLTELMDECLERGDQEGFLALFSAYWDKINVPVPEGGVANIDMAFSNLLVQGERWSLIDYEWLTREKVETREIAFRALYCYLLGDPKREKLNQNLILTKLSISPEEVERYKERELAFQRSVTGNRRTTGELRDLIGCEILPLSARTMEDKEEERRRLVQVYEDRGEGYSEENSRFLRGVRRADGRIAIDYLVPGEVKELRIDPAISCCAVRIEELALDGEAIPVNRKTITVNGRWTGKNTVVFGTEDPNLLLSCEGKIKEKGSRLTALLEVVLFSPDMARELERKAIW